MHPFSCVACLVLSFRSSSYFLSCWLSLTCFSFPPLLCSVLWLSQVSDPANGDVLSEDNFLVLPSVKHTRSEPCRTETSEVISSSSQSEGEGSNHHQGVEDVKPASQQKQHHSHAAPSKPVVDLDQFTFSRRDSGSTQPYSPSPVESEPASGVLLVGGVRADLLGKSGRKMRTEMGAMLVNGQRSRPRNVGTSVKRPFQGGGMGSPSPSEDPVHKKPKS